MNKKIIMIAIMACCAQVAVAQNNTDRRVADNPETQTPIQLDATPARTPIVKKKRTVPVMQARSTAQAEPVQKQAKVSDNDSQENEGSETGVRAKAKKAQLVTENAEAPRKSMKQEINKRRAPQMKKPMENMNRKKYQKAKPMPKEKAVDW